METILKTNWKCQHTWKRASKNTMWCLAGCSIGDLGTIAFFQYFEIPWSTISIMILAIINGLITSIILETLIMMRQTSFVMAFRTAIGMSFISMLTMEIAMNVTDIIITGEAKLTFLSVPLMLIVGFISPLPYNYWRLKVLGVSCH